MVATSSSTKAHSSKKRGYSMADSPNTFIIDPKPIEDLIRQITAEIQDTEAAVMRSLQRVLKQRFPLHTFEEILQRAGNAEAIRTIVAEVLENAPLHHGSLCTQLKILETLRDAAANTTTCGTSRSPQTQEMLVSIPSEMEEGGL
jgi:hypothetical protein